MSLQIHITPKQLKEIRQALGLMKDLVLPLTKKDVEKILDGLPPYLHSYKIIDEQDYQFWYAARSEEEARGLHRSAIKHIERMEHDITLTVFDANPENINDPRMGPITRPLEDWANDRGHPYLIACTV